MWVLAGFRRIGRMEQLGLELAQVKAEIKMEFMDDEDAISSLAGLCLPEPPCTSWEQGTAASAADVAQRRAEEGEAASLALVRRLQEQEQEQGAGAAPKHPQTQTRLAGGPGLGSCCCAAANQAAACGSTPSGCQCRGVTVVGWH